MSNPSSYRPPRRRVARRDDLFFEILGSLGEGPRPYKGRMGVLRRTVTLWFAAPPKPGLVDSARRSAGNHGWRVKVRVKPGGPPGPEDGGAAVREPRRPAPPSGQMGAHADP